MIKAHNSKKEQKQKEHTIDSKYKSKKKYNFIINKPIHCIITNKYITQREKRVLTSNFVFENLTYSISKQKNNGQTTDDVEAIVEKLYLADDDDAIFPLSRYFQLIDISIALYNKKLKSSSYKVGPQTSINIERIILLSIETKIV